MTQVLFGLQPSDIKYIKEQIALFPEIQKVKVFGSRAIGNYKEGSDVDMALCGENISLDTLSQLKSKLQEEGPLPYLFDLVHFETIENDALKRHIDEFGIELR